MGTNTQNDQDQEIDLTQVFKKIGSFFDGIATSIFKVILFIKKNILIFIFLFLVGAVLGYFLDYNSKQYNSKVIVSPNFGSVDYLYNKINLINARIQQKDSSFLKKIGLIAPININKVSIKPIVDIYSFVNENRGSTANNAQNTQNFELVKLLSEDGDINKVIKDSLTSRNYNHHEITIITDGFTTNKQLLDPLLTYLNNSEFYNKIKKANVSNINSKISFNEQVINQIDGLLNQFSSSANATKNDKLVYYNENTQLNDIISNKNQLNNYNLELKTQLLTSDKVIVDRSRILNIRNNVGTNGKLKFILPLILIAGFLLYTFLLSFYKNQEAKLSK